MAKISTTIPPKSHLAIPVNTDTLATDRDFLFDPAEQAGSAVLYALVVDCHLRKIQARNDSDNPVTILADTRLGRIIEYDADGYTAIPTEQVIAIDRPGSMRGAVKELLGNTSPANPPLKTRLFSRVTVYGPAQIRDQLGDVVSAYPQIWQDNGNAVDVPKDQYMELPLIENRQDQYKAGKAKVYPLEAKDKELS